MRQETAALRDFNSVYVGSGSKAADQWSAPLIVDSFRRRFRPQSALPPRANIVQVIPAANSCERGHGSLAGLSVPARGSSAADLTTRYIPSHTPSLETDSVGKSHRAPTPGPDTVVA